MYKISIAFLVIFFAYSPLGSWSFFSKNPEPVATPQPIEQSTRFTLMINPAGDARDPGREIDNSFERIITMECAEFLKKELEKNIPGLRVILTRFQGEIVQPIQNASFANRLDVNLYLSLHVYQEQSKNLQLYIYRFLYNPHTDIWDKKSKELELLPFNQAYRFNLKRSETVGKLFYETCSKETSHAIKCHKPVGLPSKPLIGIIAPSLAIELGIKKKDDWINFIPMLIMAITAVIEGAA